MPLGSDVRYRFKKGTHTRLAFRGNDVVEAKNMKTGATHTPAEFEEDKEKKAKKKGENEALEKIHKR